MDPATLLTLTQTIIQVLDSSFVNEVVSLGSFRTQVAKLRSTTSTIKAALVDAEEQARQLVPMTTVERDWLEKLKDAVYQADDLFDYIVYIYQRKTLGSGNAKLLNEVRLFFSHCNQLAFALSTSHKVRQIRERLDDIAKDHRDFCFRTQLVSGVERLVTKKREDSHSFVCAEDVIGRDADKMAVLGMLLDSSVEEVVHFVTIVGIGGLGKTSLAQLIYNDSKIQTGFDLKLWVCVSDEYDIRDILCKLLGSTANQHIPVNELHRRVRRKIQGKKYFLVLDDVWNEDRHKWLELRDLLVVGRRGSRVLVTSRSKLVATIVGGSPAYELKGLSPKHSWQLFQKMAFRNEEEQTDADFIEIGKCILNKCANVPLAIRVVGSLLYGQTKSIWKSFTTRSLMNMRKDDKDGILPILKLSYHHLTLPLKSCFSFCALFPKDYRIEKEVLFGLWMAHGFLIPSEGQRVKDLAEEYFMILLQRCFFQDAGRDESGDIVVCKLHDLMHDVAQEVVGTDICTTDSISDLKAKPLHLSFSKLEILSGSNSFNQIENIRTFFKLYNDYSGIPAKEIKTLLEKAKRLRVLCFSRTTVRTLPSMIDKLVHLRYLDLSHNYELENLPARLSRLLNLQTLNLAECCNLKELPQGLSKLEKLRYLEIDGCGRLTYMPPRMSKLTCLEKLQLFIVNDIQMGEAQRGKLQDLESLTNLEGSLKISVCGSSTKSIPQGAKCVRGMKHLSVLHVEISCLNSDVESNLLLEGLQPNCNLEHFTLSGYNGAAFSKWESTNDLGASLPNLVQFSLYQCENLQHLPLLSRLCHLKTLRLCNLDNLEYIEDCVGSSSSLHDQPTSFPCLENLHLQTLPKLNLWRKSSESMAMGSHLRRCDIIPYSFPRLLVFEITSCPFMTSIPLISNLNTLILSCERNAPCSSSFLSLCCLTGSNELTIKVCNNENFDSLSVVEDLFQSHHSTSLRSLHIKGWRYLKSLCGGGLDQLTGLRTLLLSELDELDELGDISGHMPWKHLSTLCSLEIYYLPKLVTLPTGIFQCLTNLQSLRIEACDNLKSSSQSTGMDSNLRFGPIPYSFPCLTDLIITSCPFMTSIPLISNLNTLILSCERNAPCSSSFLSSCCLSGYNELTIKVCNNENLDSLSVVEDLFRSHLSTSLRSLHISGWPYLKSLYGGLEKLTGLQTLLLSELDELDELGLLGDISGNMLWKHLSNLCSLEIYSLPKLVTLPEGILQCLTGLQSLRIEACDNLNSSSQSMVMGSNFRCGPMPYSFPCLTKLYISSCPYMTSIPLISNLKTLILTFDRNAPCSSSFLSSCYSSGSNKLTIKVCNNKNLVNLSVFEDLFRSHLPTSLQSLIIDGWPYLKSLCGGGLEQLTALRTLKLQYLDQLDELEDNSGDHTLGMLPSGIRSLKICYLPKLVTLPQSIQCLDLQMLKIVECDNLDPSPEFRLLFDSIPEIHISMCFHIPRLHRNHREIFLRNGRG